MSQTWVNEAVAGGDVLTTTLADSIGKAVARMDEVTAQMAAAKEEDTARWQSLNDERKAQAAILTELQSQYQKAKVEEEHQRAVADVEEIKAKLAQMRAPSKAGIVAGARSRGAYQDGDFIGALMDLSPKADPDVRMAAKARLSEMSRREEAFGKATLGTSDATGGWIVPNAIVDALMKPATVSNIYRDLMTVVPGVTTAAVDMPYRATLASRAVIADFGTLKENVDLSYNGYTATIYTLARVYDIGNQFLRQSRGAAEADVMGELASAFALGESYYIREGTGSSQPYGYTPALTNGPSAYRTTFTASATTLAGSIAAAVANAAGAMAARGAAPTAAVMSASAYWTMLAQGTDTAGFFFAPTGGPGAIRPGTLQTPFGVPIYPDAAADVQGTAAVIDNLVIGNWRAAKLFLGAAYRVDSSDVANTRWDYNLTGFRGEMEMGVDFRPAVYSGNFQMITDILP
jgi:HK97 family phage major capsid protein